MVERCLFVPSGGIRDVFSQATRR